MFNHDSLDIKEGSVEDLIIDPDGFGSGSNRSVCLGVSLDGGEQVTGMLGMTGKRHRLSESTAEWQNYSISNDNYYRVVNLVEDNLLLTMQYAIELCFYHEKFYTAGELDLMPNFQKCSATRGTTVRRIVVPPLFQAEVSYWPPARSSGAASTSGST